jgi:hypothetical protein
MPGLSGADSDSKKPAATKAAPAKSARNFTSGKQVPLNGGKVNPNVTSVRSKDPERNLPKKSLADGTPPKVGMKVWLAKGDAPAKITETFQIAAKVELEDGKTRTTAYSQMSARK